MQFTLTIESDEIEADDAQHFVMSMLRMVRDTIGETGELDGADDGVARVVWTVNG